MIPFIKCKKKCTLKYLFITFIIVSYNGVSHKSVRVAQKFDSNISTMAQVRRDGFPSTPPF